MATSKDTKKIVKCGEEIQKTHKPETTSQCDFFIRRKGIKKVNWKNKITCLI